MIYKSKSIVYTIIIGPNAKILFLFEAGTSVYMIQRRDTDLCMMMSGILMRLAVKWGLLPQLQKLLLEQIELAVQEQYNQAIKNGLQSLSVSMR